MSQTSTSHRLPLIFLTTALLGTGCQEAAPPAASSEIVCVDTATQAAFVIPATTTFPAKNPVTGAATLMPAMYCPKCQSWYVAPPIEQLHRQKGVAYCPKTGTPLQTDGPRPTRTGPQP